MASCASELSIPTTLAPRRANQAETYAVPQPSSIASFPARSSGNIPTSDSGTLQIPHAGVSLAHPRSPAATYCSAASSHRARFVGGMRRRGYETEFREYPQGWRVNVRRGSVDPVVGSGWAATPGEAAQMAAWATVTGGTAAR